MKKPSGNKNGLIPHIKRYHISQALFNESIKILKKRGKKREEGLVLWSGIINRENFEAYILNSVIPEGGHWGGGVTLDYKMLLQIIQLLGEKKQILLAQVHTHPGNFGHSLGDEKTPVSHRIGFISIVVPNYAIHKIKNMKNFYVYEYLGDFKWKLYAKNEINKKFVIYKSIMRV